VPRTAWTNKAALTAERKVVIDRSSIYSLQVLRTSLSAASKCWWLVTSIWSHSSIP